MGDSDFKKNEGAAPEVQKEKRRRRTVVVEPVRRTPRPDGEKPTYQSREQSENRYDRNERSERTEQTERRSYNPNFSADNRFIGGSKPSGSRYDRPERDFNRRDDYPESRSERLSRPYNKEPHGDKPYYGNRTNSNRPYGERTNSDRPYQPRDKKPNKPFVKKSREGVMDPGMKPTFYPSYTVANSDKEIRLNRFIAMSGQCSRREADEFIQAGDVMVNGEVVTAMGTKISPTDTITFKGKQISSEKKVYIVMNKPKGYVTSIDDPHAEKTVMDIVKNACNERIYPVGRLDKSSVGVLLLTNDGDLTERLTHPSHNKRKVYQVTLDAPLTNYDLMRARDGIDLDDGVIIPDAVDFVKPDNRKEVGIEIHSGRNRIVRRIFEELGYGVHKLDRVYFAGLTKKNLKRGQWRFLTDREVAMLKSGRYE
jgi:23S rRNA pseudouridine2605 synthase